jgi:hypothetical protein
VLPQKSETLGDRIRRKEVVNAIQLDTQDILKIGTISNNIVNSAVRSFRREEIYGRKEGKEPNEKLRRETVDRCRRALGCADGHGCNEDLSHWQVLAVSATLRVVDVVADQSRSVTI